MTPNQPRFVPGRGGHVESYFLRANDPVLPRALWIKATLLEPKEGPAVAEAWFIFFDGVAGRTFAHRETVPWTQGAFLGGPGDVTETSVAGTRLRLGPGGHARGELTRDRTRARWDLTFSPADGAVAEPLSIFPWRFLLEGPFPKSKLLTPFPSLRFAGTVELGADRFEVDGWTGMQGHNWGKEHAFEYAWGQCLFPADARGPEAMVEGFSGRIRIAGRASPRLSALVVRRGAQTWRFDRIFDPWRQQAELGAWRWRVGLKGPGGEVELFMDAGERPLVCLGYQNPDGAMRYCFNSKLAKTRLRLRPKDAPAFELESAHGGALELLQARAHPDFPTVI